MGSGPPREFRRGRRGIAVDNASLTILRDLLVNGEVEEAAAAFWLGIGCSTVMTVYTVRVKVRPPNEFHLDWPIDARGDALPRCRSTQCDFIELCSSCVGIAPWVIRV